MSLISSKEILVKSFEISKFEKLKMFGSSFPFGWN